MLLFLIIFFFLFFYGFSLWNSYYLDTRLLGWYSHFIILFSYFLFFLCYFLGFFSLYFPLFLSKLLFQASYFIWSVVPLSFWLFPFCIIASCSFVMKVLFFFLIFLTVLMIDFWGKHSLLPLVYVYSVLFFICSLPFLSWTCSYLLIRGSLFMWRRSNKKLIRIDVCGIFSFLLLTDGLYIKWFDRELDFFGGKPLISVSKNIFSLVSWFLQR